MNTSATLPIFENVANEVLDLLEREEGTLARDYVRRAHDLLREFKSWEKTAPTPERRSQAVADIIDLHREVQEFKARKRTPVP